jgi:hypothetical protein
MALGKENSRHGTGAVGSFFAEGRPSAKKKKLLPRASSLALGKVMFSNFPKKSLPRAIARALGKGPFFGKKNYNNQIKQLTQHIYIIS